MIHTPAAPPSTGPACDSSHAVSRSTELVSCARTAVKIEGWTHLPDLQLHSSTTENIPECYESTEEALQLVRTMEAELVRLEALVRRRGHTNDPTEEMGQTVTRLEHDAQELTTLIQHHIGSHTIQNGQRSAQERKHWQMVQQWFQAVAQQQTTKLKEILKIRGTVLAEQEQRRQKFQYQKSRNNQKSNAAAYTSPLFQNNHATPNQQNGRNGTSNGSLNASNSATAPYYNHNNTNNNPYSSQYTGYGGSTHPASNGGVGGYGGSASSSYYYNNNSFNKGGMRQRKGMQQQDTARTEQQQHEQVQLQQRQQQRQTNQRLQEAQQAEKSLAELGTLFGKMSSLITQQSEVIDKVEDDVEAAFLDVGAGQREIATLHTLKKGNRALILKVFGLLIFLIIFMRFYKGK